jgi:hypothetical protein
MRAYLSRMGIICDDPLIQPVVPHLILGNAYTIPAGQVAGLRFGLAANVFLERERSGWNNSRVLRRLRHALGPCMGHVQPIPLMDAHRCHTTPEVIALCRLSGIWPLLVPAKLTWRFAAVRHSLRRCLQDVSPQGLPDRPHPVEIGRLDLAGFLRCVEQAIRDVVQGRAWASAFDVDGFGNQQADVSRRVRTALELSGALAAPSTRPTMEQLQRVFPHGVVVPRALLPSHPAALRVVRFGPRLRPPVYGPAPALWLSFQ